MLSSSSLLLFFFVFLHRVLSRWEPCLFFTTRWLVRHSRNGLTVCCWAKVARSDTGWRPTRRNRWNCGIRSSITPLKPPSRYGSDNFLCFSFFFLFQYLKKKERRFKPLKCLTFHVVLRSLQDVWLEMCTQNIQLPPASMASPDCVGHLMKLGHRAKEWQRRFCLLKDACLFFYVDINVSSALGKRERNLVTSPTLLHVFFYLLLFLRFLHIQASYYPIYNSLKKKNSPPTRWLDLNLLC